MNFTNFGIECMTQCLKEHLSHYIDLYMHYNSEGNPPNIKLINDLIKYFEGIKETEYYMSTIRKYDYREKIFTSKGYLALPDYAYPSRQDEHEEGLSDGELNLEILYQGEWIKVANIDFE